MAGQSYVLQRQRYRNLTLLLTVHVLVIGERFWCYSYGRFAETQSHGMFLGGCVSLLPALLLCSWFYYSRSQVKASRKQFRHVLYRRSLSIVLLCVGVYACSPTHRSRARDHCSSSLSHCSFRLECNIQLFSGKRIHFPMGNKHKTILVLIMKSSSEKKPLSLIPFTRKSISSSLIVVATEENDGVTVNCLGREGLAIPVRSNTVMLTVYSRPHPPENLPVTVLGPLRLNVSWSAPESLPQVQSSPIELVWQL